MLVLSCCLYLISLISWVARKMRVLFIVYSSFFSLDALYTSYILLGILLQVLLIQLLLPIKKKERKKERNMRLLEYVE